MINKLKFLVSSLIILGGYTTVSNGYCVDNNQVKAIENDQYLTRYNEYLDKLCKEGKIDIDENGNILENEKFLYNTGLNHIRSWVSWEKIHKGAYMTTALFKTIVKEIKEQISKNIIDSCDSFDKGSNDFAYNLELPQISRSLSLQKLKMQHPDIITITSEKDTITIKELETYLKNKIYKLNIEYLIKIKKYCMQYNNNIEELENNIKQETINYYNKIKPIIDWLPGFFKACIDHCNNMISDGIKWINNSIVFDMDKKQDVMHRMLK